MDHSRGHDPVQIIPYIHWEKSHELLRWFIERRTILSSFCILCRSVSMVRKKVGGFAFSLCWTTNSWRRKNAKGHHMELSISWYLSALCFLFGATKRADEFTAWINGQRNGWMDQQRDDRQMNGQTNEWGDGIAMDEWMDGQTQLDGWMDRHTCC